MQAPQLRPRLGADRLHQRGPGLTVGGERFGLPATAVQRQHPLRVQPLAQRLGGNKRLELSEHLAVSALRQVVLDRKLDRGQPQLLEPADLRARERLLRHVIQRRAAPQRQRLARRRPRDEPLKALRIDGARAEPQLVAASARDDLRAVPARCERLAQLGHVDLDDLGRRRRRLLAPEPVDQTHSRDRGVGVERQHRQQRARLAPAEGDLPPVDAGLHGSQDLDVYLSIALRRPYPRRRGACNRRLPGFADPTARALPARATLRPINPHHPEAHIHTSAQLARRRRPPRSTPRADRTGQALPRVPELPLGSSRRRRQRSPPWSRAARPCAVHTTTHPRECLMTSINIRRAVAAIVAASCMAIPVSASAQTLPPTFRSDAAQSDATTHDHRERGQVDAPVRSDASADVPRATPRSPAAPSPSRRPSRSSSPSARSCATSTRCCRSCSLAPRCWPCSPCSASRWCALVSCRGPAAVTSPTANTKQSVKGPAHAGPFDRPRTRHPRRMAWIAFRASALLGRAAWTLGRPKPRPAPPSDPTFAPAA